MFIHIVWPFGDYIEQLYTGHCCSGSRQIPFSAVLDYGILPYIMRHCVPKLVRCQWAIRYLGTHQYRPWCLTVILLNKELKLQTLCFLYLLFHQTPICPPYCIWKIPPYKHVDRIALPAVQFPTRKRQEKRKAKYPTMCCYHMMHLVALFPLCWLVVRCVHSLH